MSYYFFSKLINSYEYANFVKEYLHYNFYHIFISSNSYKIIFYAFFKKSSTYEHIHTHGVMYLLTCGPANNIPNIRNNNISSHNAKLFPPLQELIMRRAHRFVMSPIFRFFRININRLL